MESAVAIVGMAGRFPQSPSLEHFWSNLRCGVEAIRSIPDEDLLAAGVTPAALQDPAYVRRAGVLENVDLFDATFFGLSAREAALIDPQQRLLLECSWEALEAAGYDCQRIGGQVGVYVGASINSYFLHYLFSPRELLSSPGAGQSFLGNDKDFLATRISYKLGLQGPSLSVQSACSTSLVAVHLACQSLLDGECDMTLAGGVSVRVPQVGYFYQPGGILSPDGRLRAFDAEAGGSVLGSGVGVVVLKRLEDALSDRDPIRAVILGSAVNNDGALRVGYTAPSVEGQAAVIAEALAVARVDPRTVGYVEAHGSGTPLGDPIELAALHRALGGGAGEHGRFAVGSVKANIGHLDAAAGVAGLVKTVLALEHGEIPPSLHFRTPNPQFDFAGSSLYVNAELRRWPANEMPRRAGVSSFGMGGTNAHVVLEQAPDPAPSSPSRAGQLLLVSAATASALAAATGNLAGHLRDHAEVSLADVAYTLQVGRKVMRHRRALVCSDAADAVQALAACDPGRMMERIEARTDRPVAFLLPGQGEHYPEMGRGLYESEPAFREAVELCSDLLAAELGLDLREALYAADAGRAEGAGLDLRALIGRAGAPADRPVFAQPAAFVVGYALAQLWKEWGVVPAALLGDSLGEYLAACLAGVLPLADALRAVALRAQWIERLPAGAMLAVPLTEGKVLPLLGAHLSLSAVNGTAVCVVGGPPEAVRALEKELARRGSPSLLLRTSHAFHSEMMRPIADDLARLMRSLRLRAPEIPYLSNVSGTWITPTEATDPEYWARHLLAPVRLADGLGELWSDGQRVLLELGPGSLSRLALQHPAASGGRMAVPSLPAAYEPQPDGPFVLRALGKLWLGGSAIDWAGFHRRERRSRLRLPTYPFEQLRCWVETGPLAHLEAAAGDDLPAAVATTRHGRAGLTTPYVAPVGAREAALAEIWQTVLGVEPIGREDSFFELGGHSLIAAQLMARLGVDLPVSALFEAPTVALLAAAVEEADRRGRRPEDGPIVPHLRPGELPLSFSQAREWLLDQLEPGTPAFNIAQAMRLKGCLNVPALNRAFDRIVQRHESLRTVFRARGGRPAQLVIADLVLPKPLVDLTSIPPRARAAESRRLIREDAHFSFDLAAGPLFRVSLLRMADEEHVLLVNTHHIVSDLWSIGVLLRELGSLYADLTAGRVAALPPLPIQYADYAIWQRERLQGAVLARLLAFWRGRLTDDRAPLQLPTDRPRPAVQSLRGGEVPFALDPSLSQAAVELARRGGCSLFMALLAVFSTLLHRLSGDRSIIIGTFVANRTRTELEPLIGFFVNTLVLPTEPLPDLSFRSFLAAVRTVALAAFEHAELPFEALLEELQPERSRSHTPLFQAMFALQNPPAAGSLPGLELERIAIPADRSNFDLTLWMGEEGGGLAGALTYSTDLFDRSTVARWTRHFTTLLCEAVTRPDVALAELALLSAAEREEILGWSQTPAPPRRAVRIHELFVERATRDPEATALAYSHEFVTYAELWRRAGRLARVLVGFGVGPEVRVALCSERTPDLVVALLAILAAGGAVVPLDPSYPPMRQALILEDSGAAVLLAQEHLAGALPTAGARPVLLGRAGERWPAPEIPADRPVPADAMAWLIYTSGSTGRPKGVAVTHANAVPLLLWSIEALGLGRGTRVLESLSYAFDFGVFEILTTLLAGGTFHLPGEDFGDPGRWAEDALAYGIDTVHATPSFFREVAATGVRLPAVRTLHLGGEMLRRDQAKLLLDVAGAGCVLYNGYGPTEVTVNSAIYSALWPESWPTGETVPIGRPSAENAAYVLDGSGEPVPLGVPGELLLGGPGVARGYHGRPDLTAERFVPDPFGGEPGARLYRSGDRVRWLADSNIEFRGRVDQQVKVRGFRIELGEVESALAAHPALRDAAVLARGDPPGEPRLVAYVVPAAGAAPAGGELREFLAARLPRYMVPSAFVALASLPTTPSGKLDRRALPAPGARSTPLSAAAPQTPVEEILAAVWSEVTGVHPIGADDNFFDLGGHSLLATQVTARVREALGVEIPLRALFDAPTVGGLAGWIERAATTDSVPAVLPVPRGRDLPLAFSQERIWFLARLDPESVAYHVPRVLELTGRLDVAALSRAYECLLDRHEILRTTFPEVDGAPVQRIHPAPAAGTFVAPVIDLMALPEPLRRPEERRLSAEDGRRRFDLVRGPLLRVSLVRSGEEENLALQTEHHLVHDGWAETVLLGDLIELYSAATESRAPRLPALPVQFADFASWQRHWLQGEILARQIAYWRAHLAGAPALLELPADRPRPAVLSARGGALDIVLPAASAEGLSALARRQGATLFMAALASFEALLYRLSGQHDLVVGTGVANRRRRELEGMLGMFINNLALRTSLAGDPSVEELLQRVRETCLGAYAHQDLPLDRVVDELQPERSLSHSPLFQVAFAFHDVRWPAADLPGLRIMPAAPHNRSAKFELTLIVTPGAGGAANGPERGGLAVHAEHSLDLYEATTVRRWLDAWATLISGIVADPSRRLSALPSLRTAEVHQILREWGCGPLLPASGESLCELVRAWSVRTPDAVAVESQDLFLSYGGLAQRVGGLAHRLRGAGVGPGAVVALLVERSLEAAIGQLAVLESGGAFLTVDAALPAARKSFLLADSGASVVLTRAGSAETLAGHGLSLVHVDASPPPDGDAGRPWREPLPEHLAYLIYTSGSTGAPKGVMATHRGLSNLVRGQAYVLQLEPGRRVLQFSSLSFDASIWDILIPLASGATVVLSTSEQLLPGPSLVRLLAERAIETVTLPPSALAVLPAVPLPALRTLVVAGEECPAELPARWASGRRFVNAYGPTETTVCATWAELAASAPQRPPIGRPLPGVRVHLLGPDGAPTLLGAAGEICISGASLARGYMGRPDLTAERFVPASVEGMVGERAYRTGDLARWLSSGSLEFLGRIDRQVKIRGFRIEPGEIEAALLALPGVSEAAVVASPEGAAGRRLIAYLAGPSMAEVDAAAWSAALRLRMPEHMVPSAFLTVPSLPRTTSGKVDRRRLPVPERRSTTKPGLFSDPLERRLAEIWEELLGVEGIGPDEGFFSLGGHSLLAVAVASRVRAELGVEVPLRDLFGAPNLSAFTTTVRSSLQAGSGAVPPLRPMERGTMFPLSFAQQRLWLLDQLAPGSIAYNVPLGLRLLGPLDIAALAAALAVVVDRHEVLRTTFVAADEGPLQRVGALIPAFPLVDLAGVPAAAREWEARRLAAEAAREPFDLTIGPLLRARLVRVSERDHVALLVLHHVISDGWSLGVLTAELNALYTAFASRRPSPLPPLPVQYGDFALWQREWLRGEVLAAQLAYWRERLLGAPPVLALPTDRPRPEVASGRGGLRSRQLSAVSSTAVQQLARRLAATPFMVWCALFAALLRRHTGQEDIVVGAPVANRRRQETERLIGFFVNTLALRVDLAGDLTFEALVGRVRETALGAFAHQDLPFERLVEELALERSLAHNPLFQVTLAFQNAPLGKVELTGLTVFPLADLAEGSQAVKFDLTLGISGEEGPATAALGFNGDLFDGTTAERMLGHFAILLEGAMGEASRRLSELPLLSAGEIHQLIVEGEEGDPWTAIELSSTNDDHAWRPAGAPGMVLSPELMLQPLGVCGELCIAAGDWARGVRDLPDLTAERLVPDPFGGEPGGLLYRTGELVRRRPSGALERLGRFDRPRAAQGDRTAAVDAPYAAPRHAVDEVLARIWAEVLGVDRVGILDNFFSLGGHSLMAARAVTRIRRALGVDLRLRQLFESPTVASLASALLAAPHHRESVEKTAELLVLLADRSEEELESMLAAVPEGSPA